MTKEELLKENARLQDRLVTSNLMDKENREYLSGILGSYDTGRYSDTESIKVLKWPDVYFRLGQRFAQSNNLEKLNRLEDAVSDIYRELPEKDQPESACNDC